MSLRALPALFAVLLAVTPGAAAARRIAILAGSDHYRFLPEYSLVGLESGLEELGRVLSDRFGYSTQLLLGADATHRRVVVAVTDALSKAAPDDEIIFVYSGHGQGLAPDPRKASYLVTEDCNPADPLQNCLFESLIADYSRASAARSFLMVLDSCYSGAIGPGLIMAVPFGFKDVGADGEPVPMGFRADAKSVPRRAREGLASGSPGQVTWFDPRVKRSHFMTALLSALRGSPTAPQKCVLVKDLFPRIRTLVLKASKDAQEPLHYRSPDPEVTGSVNLCVAGTAPREMAAKRASAGKSDANAPKAGRPLVAIIGSAEDYTSYHLPALAAPSAQIVDKKLRGDFLTLPITVSFAWEGEAFFRQMETPPAVIVIHASALHQADLADRAVAKFQALIGAWLSNMPEVKIVVFSRMPGAIPPNDLCDRWKSQTSFLLAGEREGRVVFLPLPHDESSFDGAPGIEMTRIVRCETGLDTDGCTPLLSGAAKRAREAVARSTCVAEGVNPVTTQ